MSLNIYFSVIFTFGLSLKMFRDVGNRMHVTESVVLNHSITACYVYKNCDGRDLHQERTSLNRRMSRKSQLKTVNHQMRG